MWLLVILFLISNCDSKETNRQGSVNQKNNSSLSYKDIKHVFNNDSYNRNKTSNNEDELHKMSPTNKLKSNILVYSPPRWIVAAVATPLVIIFAINLAIISFKLKNNDPTDIESVKGVGSQNVELNTSNSLESKSKISTDHHHKKKNKASEDIYNSMMEQFKAGKTRAMSYTGGKRSSEIKLEGISVVSPKDIARKHLLLGRLNETLDNDDGDIAINKLIETSTNAFVGKVMFRHLVSEDSVDKDASRHIKAMIERSKEDLSSCINLLPDDVKNLLPEDLEDAFTNFASWQESLL
ncbi:uncharacterized protein LOC100214063 isoform X1 [Hydra vulgaris]|uniref:uncharacterized protein LOC100214063 isoform X1 n=1 Tax=Hydra vulgaris TaxID=6087 RepID=UPI001F5E82E8|nr:uncharacterized protein LOC100214063 isoform X1 [Hydra vulgaris]XP_012566833.2 uncharacterized protein LOC100214063 isoform X1 [Hydra vulgaris]XP_012566834.2 uncharacterized protein LOC100214063 isoform X1 [Hydra vulgaris]XP_012566835.2 uncharacterized protein LOC100214063 isoform X1 [Hydra vulgaris]XP_047132386.1 uncharacterized protein LOC100214063 isoform X1 [Hydra vulgaris]